MFLKLDYVFAPLNNDNLKNRCHSKIILGHAVFQLLFESNSSLQLSLLLNSSIRWQWLHLIKARGKYKEVIKFIDNTWLLLHKYIQNDISIDWIWSCSLQGNFSFLCYDYKTLLCSFSLKFLQQCLLV